MVNKNIVFIKLYILFLILLLLASCSDGGNKEDSYMITVDKVYGDGSKYCAFTSLVKRGAFYYLAFREGESHVGEGDYGIIRIMRSRDAEKWEQYQMIKADNVDLRDPNLTVTPNGHLLLLCGARMKKQPEGYYFTKSYYAIENEDVFSEVQPLNIPPEVDDPYCCWLWKLTWNRGIGYGAAYQSNNRLTLLTTVDGVNYDIVADISADKIISETSIQFLPNNEMIILIRSEKEGYIGHSLPPYTEWSLTKTSIYLAGQDFIISDNHLICPTRLVTNVGERTTLWFGDLDGNFQWSYVVPSSGNSGDTAYSSIIEEEDIFLLAYYSMHQTNKPSIYLAIIPKVSLPFLE